LRDEIDRGRAGDKVAGPDPASTPLGTDDEAGGHPPTPEQVALAREQELKRTEPEAHARARATLLGRAGSDARKGALALAIVAALAFAISLAF
jgi:hypothetical protein